MKHNQNKDQWSSTDYTPLSIADCRILEAKRIRTFNFCYNRFLERDSGYLLSTKLNGAINTDAYLSIAYRLLNYLNTYLSTNEITDNWIWNY